MDIKQILFKVIFFNILPLLVRGCRGCRGWQQSRGEFFQLVAATYNTCLQIRESKGTFVQCKINATFTENTVFLVNPDDDIPGKIKIQIFGTKYCLDREHCHSSTSNLRYSACNHCGAIHWTINTDGSVSEDGRNNCIYRNSNGDAYIHHCTDGFQKFYVSKLGKEFQLKSMKHGDCLAGDRFLNCATSPTFYTTGLPGYLSIHIYDDPSNCIDREHCHSSTSNIRYYDCTHCGAIHWMIYDEMVAEDRGKNCVNRYKVTGTIMKHCSDSFEEFHLLIIPNTVDKFVGDDLVQTPLRFSDLDIGKYFAWNSLNQLRGVRLSKCVDYQVLQAVMTLEFVHCLSFLNAQYIATRIDTNILYSDSTSILDTMNRIVKDSNLITGYYIHYGIENGSVTNNDGLLSNFVINFEFVPATAYTATTITELLQGIRNNAYINDQYYESFYEGENNGHQWYLDFTGYISEPLYWPKSLSDIQINDSKDIIAVTLSLNMI